MVFTGNAVTTPIFAAKFGWDEAETNLNNSLINTSAVLGLTLGSLIGGKTITIGRRKAAFYLQSLAIVGALLTQIPDVRTICLGRFLYGVTAGHANIIMGKSIDETIPANISGQFGVLLNCYICVGMMSSYFLGALLPTEPSEFKDD